MARSAASRKPAPGWVVVLLAAGLSGAAALLAVNTVHTIARVTSERRGTITVSGCVFDHYGTHGDVWRSA